jgi:peptidyl-tRNA hydrolase ICT1
LQFHHRINEEGEFIIACDETRSQSQNLELCFKRLFRMVVEVSEVPREPSAEKREKIARQSAAANEKRLRDKQQQARKKRLRQASES